MIGQVWQILIDTNNSMLGGCKLVCLILGRYNTPQSLYFSTKIEKKKITNVKWGLYGD
jgi:hypothetical protein